MTNKNIILTYYQYITEKSKQIIYSLENNKKVLIYAPMRGGKTHLITNDFEQYFNSKGVRIVVVSPVTLLIDQQGDRTKGRAWGTYYSKNKCSLDITNIITTPDSLPTIISQFEEDKTPYILAIDEAHEEEGSRGFRPAFKNIELGANSQYCQSVAYFTATPQSLERSSLDKFDKYIRLEQAKEIDSKENPYIFKHSKEFVIRPMTLNLEEITKLIDRELRENPKSPIMLKLDNKKLLQEIDSYFKNKGELINFKFLASNFKFEGLDEDIKIFEAESKQLREDITNYKEIGQAGEVIAFTSLINSGIEVNNNKEAIFINLTNGTYNFINEIQSIGRFRRGLKKVILTVPPKEKKEEEQQIQSYDQIFKAELGAVEQGRKYLEYLVITGDTERIKYMLDREKSLSINTENKVLIDEIVVRAQANKLYEEQFKAEAELLLEHFIKTSGLIFDNYYIDNSDIVNDSQGEKILGILGDSRKEKEKRLEEMEAGLKDKLSKLCNETLEAIAINNPLALGEQEQKILKSFNIILKDNPATAKTIKELISCNLAPGEALRVYSTKDKAELKNIIESYRIALYNRTYQEDRAQLIGLTLKGRKKDRQELSKLVTTLDYFIRDKKIKHSSYITKKDYFKLFELYSDLGIKAYVKYFEEDKTSAKKEKILEKILKDTKEYLRQIFILTKDNNYLRYSSIRVNINDLI